MAYEKVPVCDMDGSHYGPEVGVQQYVITTPQGRYEVLLCAADAAELRAFLDKLPRSVYTPLSKRGGGKRRQGFEDKIWD